MSSQSHFIWAFEAVQETKMENIAAFKRLAVQKAYFLSLSRNTSHNQYIFLPQSSPSGKEKAVDHSHSVTLVNYSWKS